MVFKSCFQLQKCLSIENKKHWKKRKQGKKELLLEKKKNDAGYKYRHDCVDKAKKMWLNEY